MDWSALFRSAALVLLAVAAVMMGLSLLALVEQAWIVGGVLAFLAAGAVLGGAIAAEIARAGDQF